MRASPRLRAAVKSPAAQALIQAQRAARVTRPSAGFLAAELARRGGVGRYRLRDGSAVVYLRHGTRDVHILNEIFGGTGGELSYEPPAKVATWLDGGPIRILDAGGNIGLFGLYALRRWTVAALRSYEPDPENAALLRANIAANQGSWDMEQVAVSNARGTLRFAAGRCADARAALDGEVSIDVPAVDLFGEDHDVDLLKLDIEGGEWAILTDPRLATLAATAIVMEWHQHLCPEPDPHAAARRLLVGAGYEIVQDEPAEHGRNGVLWAARP